MGQGPATGLEACLADPGRVEMEGFCFTGEATTTAMAWEDAAGFCEGEGGFFAALHTAQLRSAIAAGLANVRRM